MQSEMRWHPSISLSPYMGFVTQFIKKLFVSLEGKKWESESVNIMRKGVIYKVVKWHYLRTAYNGRVPKKCVHKEETLTQQDKTCFVSRRSEAHLRHLQVAQLEVPI